MKHESEMPVLIYKYQDARYLLYGGSSVSSAKKQKYS